ncbi:DNA topology modulation protein FlaR [Bacillaceae bacterium Marseille-Q3522]|nr:DNA topology modulation protein FlaR [Bacillaceae bacterium Marseille-Q3522]
MNMKKIHIIGSVGSGKTTLARTLSTQLNIPHFELDNVVWIRQDNGDIRRTPQQRDAYLKNIIHSEAWIIEGAHDGEWILPSMESADLIIFLDTNYKKRTFRIIKRFLLQKLKLEKANYKPTLKMFCNMFEWNAQFEKQSKSKIRKRLEQYENKLLVLKDNLEINLAEVLQNK